MPRTYAYHEIRDVYNMLKDRGEVTATLPEWAQQQNNLSGSRSFDAGLDSGFGTKPLTYGLRKVMEATGIPEAMGWVGGGVGSLIGDEEMGQQVGESAGYGVSTLLPMLIPGLGQTTMALSMGGLGAANAYADTNSGLSALFAGATNALMPGVANRLEQATLGRLGGELVEGIGSAGGIRQLFPKSIPMGLATQGVSQLGAGVFGEAMRAGEALMKTDNPDDPSSTYALDPVRIGLEMTVGQLPFMGLYATKSGASQLGGRTTKETIDALRADIRRTEGAQAEDLIRRREAETPPIARLPKIEEEKSPVVQAQMDKLMARVLNQKDPVDERLSALMREADEVNSALVDPASGIDVETLTKRQIELSDALKGREAEAVYSDYNDTFEVAGEVHYRNSDRSVTIRVADTPENRAAGLEPGKLITASVMRAPESVEGIKIGWDGFGTQVKVPLSKNKKYWSYVEDARPEVTEQQRQRVSKPVAERPPELPAYTEEGFNRIKAEWETERAETKARLEELEGLKKELTDEISGMMVEVNPSPLKLSKVLTDLNEINIKMGFKPLTVKQLQEYNRLFRYDPNAKEPGHVIVVKEIHNKVERATRQAKIREQQREFLTELKANADAYIFSLRGKDDPESKRLLGVYDQKQKEIAEDKSLTAAGRTALELGLNGSFIEWASKGGQGPFVVKRQRAGSSLGSAMPRDEDGNPIIEAVDEAPTPDKAAESVAKNEMSIRLQTALDTLPDEAWVIEPGKRPRLLLEFQEEVDKFTAKFVTLSKDNTQLVVKGSPADWTKAEFPDYVVDYGLALKGDRIVSAGPPLSRAAADAKPLPRQRNQGLAFFQGEIRQDSGGNVVVLGGRELRNPVMSVGEFLSRTKVSETLEPLYRSHYPEAFEGKNVDVTKLVKGMAERPLTEVMKAGATETKSRNIGDVEHDLENLNYIFARDEEDAIVGVYDRSKSKEILEGSFAFDELPQRVQALFREGTEGHDEKRGLTYSGHYSISSNPRGGTEIAVVAKGAPGEILPSDAHHDVPGLLGTATVEEKTLGELRQTMGKDHPKLQRFVGKPDDAVIGVQTEAQSDWVGEVRSMEERVKLGKEKGEAQSELDYFANRVPSHPLLPYWERLVADAVIQHGLERGWEGVVVTDAKTAAMTEGHDTGAHFSDPLGYENNGDPKSQKVLITKPEDYVGANGYKDAQQRLAKEAGLDPALINKHNNTIAVQTSPNTRDVYYIGWWNRTDKMQFVVMKWPETRAISQFPGHAQHYGDPDFRIGAEATPGSLQQEFAKATGEENTLRKGGGSVLAVGVHKGAEGQQFSPWIGMRNGQEIAGYPTEAAARADMQVRQYDDVQYKPKPPVGSPSLTDPHPITGVVGPKVYATGNFYSFDKVRRAQKFPELSLKEGVIRQGQSGVVARPAAPRVRAGSNFIWDFIPYDEATNKLGKHTLPKTGVLKVAQFKNMAGEPTLADSTIALGREFVPEAFEGDSVDVRKLYQGLKEKGPVVEVKKLGEGLRPQVQPEAQRRIGEIQHQLDTELPQGWNQYINENSQGLTDAQRALVREYSQLQNERHGEVVATDPRYSFLGPKSEQDMPGYVEGLVRATGPRKFKHDHFDQDNVLAFFRGYEETLPDGRKAFHVIEVQSDWGQRRRELNETKAKHLRDLEDQKKRGYEPGEGLRGVTERGLAETERQLAAGGHPLLSVYEPLALKAAIDHARSIGADALILSDGETAMMTEGHDKQTPMYRLVGEGLTPTNPATKESIQRYLDSMPANHGYTMEQVPLSQDNGMRLHYDTTLPSALRKLTGVEGERVELGAHVKAGPELPITLSHMGGEDILATPPGSPVFRNPDGTPKSSITGRLYDLRSAFANMDQRGGFTLGNPRFAGPQIPPLKPANADQAKIMSDVGSTGRSLLEYTKTNPRLQGLARDLEQYGSLLDTVNVVWTEDKRTVYMSAREKARSGTIILGKELFDYPDMQGTMMHELLHHFTLAEIANPVKKVAVDGLEKLRFELIKSLPKDIKADLLEKLKSDWYTRYVRGDINEQIHADPYWNSVLYGLIDQYEFVAEGGSSYQLQSFMKGVKRNAPPEGWFQKFKNFFKQLGGHTDTALDEFFSYTSRIVETNNAMVQFDKYFDSFFRNKGVLNEQALRGYKRHVYGLVRSLDGTRVLDVTMQNLQSPEVKQARKVLDANLKSDANELADLAPELGIRPNLKGVDDLFDMFVSDDVPNRNLMFDLLPGATKNYLAQKAKEIENVASFIASLGAAEHKNITNVLGTKELVASANEALGQIKGFREAYERHVQGLDIAQTLNDAANPQSGMDRIFAAVKQGGKAVEAFGLDRNAVSKVLEPGAQLSRRDPLFAEAWNKVLLTSNTVSRFVESATSYFHKNIVDGRVTGDSQQAFERSKEVVQTPKLVTGVERWVYESQMEGNEKGQTTLISETNPQMQKHLAGMTPEERVKVRDFMSKMLMSKNDSDVQTLGLMKDEAVSYGVQLLMLDNMAGRLDELSAVSAKALDAIRSSQTDPAKTQQAIAELGQIVPQATLLKLLELHESNANVLQANQDYMTFNSFFVSAQRGKKFKFEYYDTVSGTYVRSSADNKVEAAHIARGAKIRDWKPNDFSDIPERGPGDEVRLERINEFVKNQRETMVKLGLDGEILAAYDKMDVGAQAEREFLMSKDLNMAKPKNRSRTLSKGAEYLPWLDQFFGGLQRTANYWVKRNLQVQIDTMLKHPDYKNAPETTRDIKNLMKGFLQNDPESVRVAQRITTVWGLGFNVASYLANGTQTVMRLLPELINSTGNFVRSSINLAKTWADYRKHKGQGVPWRTAEENQFHREALQEGRIDLSQFDESAARQQMRGTDWMKLIRRGGPKAKSETVASTFDKVATASMWLFRQGERANATVSLISAFRTLKEVHPDWSYAQLKKEAYAIHAAANDVGGRANRSIGLFSGDGKFARGAAMLATTLQSYNIGSLSSMARYGSQIAGGSNAKTPAQRYAASKALGTMLAVQFGAAGVLGLPFVTALTSILDKFMPEIEANKKLREFVAGLFGDDEEEGNALMQAMMTGLPSMTGWDWQSRLTMGNPIPGVNEYNGFQPEAMLGAPANLAGKIIGSGFKMLRGDVGGAMMGVMPPAFKKLSELVSEDGMVKDYAGRPVLNDLSPTEKAGIAIGFNPKRLSDFNALDRIAKLNQENRQAEKNVWIQELADMVVKGNFGYVRSELTKRMQADPEFKAQDAIKSISSTAEALTFPRDLRREGTKTDAESRSLLLRNFGMVGQPANEKTRILFRQRIEQQFGLISRDKTALSTAELMDRLLTENPTMTRAEARRTVEKHLRKRTASPLNLQSVPGVGLNQGQL